MAANLEYINGVPCFAFKAGTYVWHGEGQALPEGSEVADFIRAAMLDRGISELPLYAEMPDGTKISTGHKALILDNTNYVMEVVPLEWNVHNPRDLETIAEHTVDVARSAGYAAHPITAGSIFDGRIMWVQIHLGDFDLRLPGMAVPKKKNILASLSNEYGSSTRIVGVDTTVVCSNTFAAAMSESGKGNMASRSHRKAWDADAIKREISRQEEFSLYVNERLEYLATVDITDAGMRQYFDTLFPLTSNKSGGKSLSRNALRALDLRTSMPGNDNAPNTWYNAVNTVTYMVDHVLSRDEQSRFINSTFGNGVSKKLDALKLAVDFAEGKVELAA